jgi:phycocyanin-associated, rod
MQAVIGRSSTSEASSRSFRFEVSGLRQSDVTDRMDHDIRLSGNVMITVPFSRMNEEMQRIARLGGKIVSIQPLTVDSSASAPTPSEG